MDLDFFAVVVLEFGFFFFALLAGIGGVYLETCILGDIEDDGIGKKD